MDYTKITPEGTKDILFQESKTQRLIERRLAGLFEQAGYSEVMTPGVEYFDAMGKTSYGIPQEEMFKATDNTGRLIVMRPDSTLPIARMAASRLKDAKLPVRLFYSQPVYRNNPDLSGRNNEIFQMGIELLGCTGMDADIEAISLAVKAMDSFISGYRVEIGNALLFSHLSSRLNASVDTIEAMREYIEAKNYAGLDELLDSLQSSKEVEAIRKLPRLFGGYEIFSEAEALCGDAETVAMFDYMKKLYASLCELGLEDKIMLDLGLVQLHDYYSGIIFSIYAEESGDAVIVGGRYDNLLGRFGRDLPAIGFSVDTSAIRDILLTDTVKQQASVKSALRIALTKGRLEKKFGELLQEAGIATDALNEKSRKLIVPIDGGSCELILAKAADVITYVEHGVCDIGIVGKDTIMECKGSFFEILDLNIGKCKFALAAPKGKDFFSGYSKKRVATKYPNVARAFFENMQMDVQTIKIEGSVELAPLLELSDGIVDIVETGRTLEENGLEVKVDIAAVSARMIVNASSLKLRKEEIENLAEKLEKARGSI